MTKGTASVDSFNLRSKSKNQSSRKALGVPGEATGVTGRIGLLVALMPWLLAIDLSLAQTIAINCGGEAITEHGVSFQGDHPYSALRGSGYLGGSPVRMAMPVPIGGTEFDTVARFSRTGRLFSYRFDVANGLYEVTLLICENWRLAAGFRAFSVRAGSKELFRGLDPAGMASKGYAIEYRALCQVDEGTLRLSVVASKGKAILAGIVLRPVLPDTVPPAAPAHLQAHAGFNEVILAWEPNAEEDVSGYLVRRLGSASEFQLLSRTPLTRYVDRHLPLGGPPRYRVQAEDLYGNLSPPVEIVAPPPLPLDATGLKVFAASASDHELRVLWKDALRDRLVHGFLDLGRGPMKVSIRHRGETSRFLAKPSLKFIFKRPAQPSGRRRFNLKSEAGSPSILAERLASLLFRRANVPVPTVTPIHLQINGGFSGLYNEVEQVDTRFLTSIDLPSDSPLFKMADYTMWLPDTFGASMFRHERKAGTSIDQEDFWQLIKELNTVNPFVPWFKERFDADEVISFLAAAALTSNSFDSSSFYLARNGTKGRYLLIPWDLNNGAMGERNADLPCITDRPLIRNAMQGYGLRYGRFNLLFTRILLAPELRHLLALRIADLVSFLEGPEFVKAVDDYHAAIRADALADVRKSGYADASMFLKGPARMKQYATGRADFLRLETWKLDHPRSDLVISEVMVINRTTLADNQGDFDPWIEIENRSTRAVDVGGMLVTNDLRDRTRFPLPPGTMIPPVGHLLLFADGEPGEGPLHTSFRLDPDAGSIGLSDPSSGETISALVYGAQIPDVSYGLQGGTPDRIVFLSKPTPGKENPGEPFAMLPVERVRHRPLFPGSSDRLTVLARADTANLSSLNLFLRSSSRQETLEMFDDGRHGDGRSGDGLFAASSAPWPAGALVHYSIEAIYHDRPIDRLYAPADGPGATYQLTIYPDVVPKLYLNEILASNRSGITDEFGDHADWVEILNGDDHRIDLGGMYLTDNLANPFKWRFAQGVSLGPSERLLVWLDGEPGEGPLHANFRIKARGDQLRLTHRYEEGALVIDQVTFPAQRPDTSYARCPDGGAFGYAVKPTPGAPNGPCAVEPGQ